MTILITPTLAWIVDSFDYTPAFDVGLGAIGDVGAYTTLRLQYSTDGSNWTDYTVVLLTVTQVVNATITVSATPLGVGLYLFRVRIEELVATGSPWMSESIGPWSTSVTVVLAVAPNTAVRPVGVPNFNPITTTTLRHRNFPVPAGYPHSKGSLVSPYGHRPNQRLGSTFRSGSPIAHRIGSGTKLPPRRK